LAVARKGFKQILLTVLCDKRILAISFFFAVIFLFQVSSVNAITIFSTASITSVHTAPLGTHSFVVAYCDDTADKIAFKVYDTNGTNTTTEIDVDTSAGTCSYTAVGVSAFNSTTFVIGWDDRVDQDATFAVYDSTGALKTGPIDADKTLDTTAMSVQVSALNSTHFVIGWYDSIAGSSQFAVYNSAGTLKAGPITVDDDVGTSNSVSTSAFNSTTFVIGWFDGTDQDATFAVYDSAGTLKTGPIDADTAVGSTSLSVSVSAFNSTHFVIGWYDNVDYDTTFSVYMSSGTLATGPIDADSDVSDISYSVQVSTFNSTHFVISWYDGTDFDLSYQIYNSSSSTVLPIIDIEPWPTVANVPFKYQSPTSQEVGSGLAFCNRNWIIAYANTTTQAVWRSYTDTGGVWNGICDTTPPIVKISSPTNSTYQTTSVWANVTLDEAGSWCGVSLNGTANVTMTNSTGNYNYQMTGLAQGGNNARFYCNDTANNMNGSTSNVMFFTVDTIAPTYSLNQTNSTLAGTQIKHSLNWTDNVALSGYIFSIANGTSTFVNDTWASFNGGTWSNVTKTVNSTANSLIQWCVYANDTSNNWNYTCAASPFSFLTTSATKSISITVSTALTDGIIFGNIISGTSGSPALNNSGCGATTSTCYNFTVDASSTSSTGFFNKLATAITCTGGTCAFMESGSNTYPGTASYGANTTFSTTYVAISNCNSVSAGSHCYVRYYLSPSSVNSGNYGGAGKYSYCANATDGTTAC